MPFVQQDMRALNLHRPMDAVLATCDGVNYLLTEEDLLSFFRAAHRAIKPGGALIIDVSTPYKLQHVLCSGLMAEDRENSEAQVLRLRFGLDDGQTRTLEEVGKQFNITRERIRQIEAKALRKIRHPSRSKRLKDFLE